MLLAVAVDYRSAGFDTLERLTVSAPGFGRRYLDAHPGVAGAVVVSTCNRFEVYLDVAQGGADAEALLAGAASEAGFAPEELTAGARVLTDEDVASHLFAVASGLESLVVGEVEIAGQVSRSLEAARGAGTTTPALELLFQRAARTSRSVQHRTGIGAAGRSIVRLALDLVESRITDWRTASVLLIGTGKYAGATLAALRDRGVAEVKVYSPSNRAARFARREGVSAVERAELGAVLGGSDLVIACSIAASPVIEAAQLARARAIAGEHRQMVIDLGLPRNVDPAVAALPGVDLLDLETISLHAPLTELQASDEARRLVGRAVDEYRAAQDAAAVTPAVVAFRGHVSEVLESELDRLRRHGEVDPATERALRHLASVLVHTPSARARELAAAGEADRFTDAVETLFGIEVPAAESAEPDLRADAG